MNSRSLSKADWAELAPTKDELAKAKLIVKAVLDGGFPSEYSLDGPLTPNGPHGFELFDVICILREGHTKRRAQQIRREREREP